MTEYVEAVDKPDEEAVAAMKELDSRVRDDSRHVMTKMLIPGIEMYRSSALHFRQRLLNARLAIRIARYRSEHGELPKSLADILDEKLPTAVDVYTGKPLVYETNPDGFMIYPAEDSLIGDSTTSPNPEMTRQANRFETRFSRSEQSKRSESK